MTDTRIEVGSVVCERSADYRIGKVKSITGGRCCVTLFKTADKGEDELHCDLAMLYLMSGGEAKEQYEFRDAPLAQLALRKKLVELDDWRKASLLLDQKITTLRADFQHHIHEMPECASPRASATRKTTGPLNPWELERRHENEELIATIKDAKNTGNDRLAAWLNELMHLRSKEAERKKEQQR